MISLDLIGVTKDAKTAGPGKRFELFTKGCIRGVINPCAGCFNEETWTFEGDRRTFETAELATIIERDAWNRQVTFCGGEPIIQAIALTALAKELKERDSDFHIVMYTAYKLDTLLKHGLKFTWTPQHGEGMLNLLAKHAHNYCADYSTFSCGNYLDPVRQKQLLKVEFTILANWQVAELMKYVDIIVDGDYQEDKRLTTDTYMHEGWFIGSSNQRVIFCDETRKINGYEKGCLSFLHADEYNEQMQKNHKCKACGHAHGAVNFDFCSVKCNANYKKRVAFLNNEGIPIRKGVY